MEETDKNTGAIQAILGVEKCSELAHKRWLKEFSSLSEKERIPWFDGALFWLEERHEKWENLISLPSVLRNEVFKILTAGLWGKNEIIERNGLAPVRTEHPIGTGWIKVSDTGVDNTVYYMGGDK